MLTVSVSAAPCNKAYFVKINAKPAYFIVAAAKMSIASLDPGGSLIVRYLRPDIQHQKAVKC